MSDDMKTFRYVCKSCEEIVEPRLEFDEMGRESNSHCPTCGSKMGNLEEPNPNLHYIGKDNDGHGVFIRHETPTSNANLEELPKAGDVEDYL